VCRYTHGIKGSYFFVFESIPIVIAAFLINLVYPGVVMRGKTADLPSRQREDEYARGKLVQVTKDLVMVLAVNMGVS
jgi:hypothetical protein